MTSQSNTRTIGLLAVIAALLVACGGLWWTSQDTTLAVVNGEKLTKDRLYDDMYAQIGPQVQEDLINRMLVLQEGKAKNVTVTAKEIDAELKEVKDSFGVSTDEELEQMLMLQGGMSLESLKEQVKIWLTVREIMAPTITVNEEEIQKYFDEHQDEFGEAEQIKARHVLVETESEAQAILEQLRSGADFATIAKEKSLDEASAVNGGDLGLFPRGKMVPEFDEVAFALAVNDLSDPVKTEFGYHVIQVLEKKDAVKPVLEDVKDEIQTALTDQKVQEQYPSWLDELRKQAKIES